MPRNGSKMVCLICSISFILFSFLAAVHFWCYYEPFYASEHRKLTLYGKSIADHIGISLDELDELTSFTLNYLNDKDASLDLQMKIKGQIREVFTQEEKQHMVDVQRLNLIANKLLLLSGAVTLVCLAYLIITKQPFSTLFYVYKRTMLTVLAVFAVLGIWVFIDFDSFWTLFHHIFFPGNELWILDLRKDVLIMIVPPEFFYHLVIRILFTFIALLIGGYLMLKRTGRA